MASSTITPARARPNLPQPVGPTATASVAELRLLAGGAMAGAKSTVEKRQWSVRLFAEHLAQFPGQTWQQRWLASGLEQPDALLGAITAQLRRVVVHQRVQDARGDADGHAVGASDAPQHDPGLRRDVPRRVA